MLGSDFCGDFLEGRGSRLGPHPWTQLWTNREASMGGSKNPLCALTKAPPQGGLVKSALDPSD